ncbi:FecR domain-containing protein [Sinomicrobium kalidii]|uniref:FecR family protein n=1 Tax=Sinomicrobium kalidii TaxID=2900738 RepID=UPI001E453247|nr:FecR family protein [Sinomicrobium kalidii]UGU16466.1 FecR domain-containing protein [Sinomicrobium kalidii]
MEQKDKDLENYFEKSWEDVDEDVDTELINASWDNFSNKLFNEKKKSKVFPLYLKVASVAVILIVLAFSVNLLIDNSSQTVLLTNTTNRPMQIVLEDSTSVVIGLGSTLEYPEHFGDSDRKVVLKGEAFFKVTEDKSRPFHVIAGKTTTTVLGTSFNISADSLGHARISLFTGAVNVTLENKPDSWAIRPGEEFQLYDEGKSKIAKFDEFMVAAWRMPSLHFNDTPLEKVFRILEKRYQTHIISRDSSVLDKKITLNINKNDSLEKILEIISLTHKLKIMKDKKSGIITLYK